MAPGYYRFPTICADTVVFACEDDLWAVAATGGVARRLTAGTGEALHPALSPDGQWLAYSGRDEGTLEVYLMPATGGQAQRLTFFGAPCYVVGWTPDSAQILFSSNAGQPMRYMDALYTIAPTGGEARLLPTGLALSISYGPQGGAVIARHMTDLARWKRYRGGQTGDLWVDQAGDGAWQRLVRLAGNLATPLWVGERIYFVSDHDGVGNLYSVLPNGDDLRQHTDHADFYVRHPASDGKRIVYHAGADLWLFDPATNKRQLISIETYSAQPQRARRFVYSEYYLQGWAPHPTGQSLAVIMRGRAYTLGTWEGAPLAHGDETGRARLITYLADGKRIALFSDAVGEETLEIHSTDGNSPVRRYEGLDVGWPLGMVASPRADLLAITNQRHELLLVDCESGSLRVLDRSPYARISGVSFSPDGRWLAYAYADSQRTQIIRLCAVASGERYDATRPMFYDHSPAWDPDGNYLYFIGIRDLAPLYDQVQHDWAFPRAARPFLITLRADLPSPFEPRPFAEEERKEEPAPPEPKAEKADKPEGENDGESKPEPAKKRERQIEIDLPGLPDRLVAFPVPIGLYRRIRGIKGKALFTVLPLRGSSGDELARLEVYDFAERSHDTLLDGVSDFRLTLDGKMLVYHNGRRLRVIRAGEKPKEQGGVGRKSGWVELDRVKVDLLPPREWRQMYREAWRLQRDRFWTEDMSGVDWEAAYARYLPLLDRVATRREFADLLAEMQGELGTSHTYEVGGDYQRQGAFYRQGHLGIDSRYDGEGYRIERIVAGDRWVEGETSPLARPGLRVQPGDRLVAINGKPLSASRTPGALLVNQAGNEVALSIVPAGGSEPRIVTVRALHDEFTARYRDWVEANRAAVHAASNGRVGYVHVPDMHERGFAEFLRLYLPESTRDGLIIDVRYNAGGNVSEFVIAKLVQRRVGYKVSRWGEPWPYPRNSTPATLVALTNENTSSDGDIFSHAFRLLGLGPLVGTRTWGGVIGYLRTGNLVDGGYTTQPEYSSWFPDVGWNIENYGTEPTIEVAIAPQDYVAGRDPQLERGISEALRLLEDNPTALPDFGPKPRLGKIESRE
jgi:tricorn protease